jgi:hypothetical protein
MEMRNNQRMAIPSFEEAKNDHSINDLLVSQELWQLLPPIL